MSPNTHQRSKMPACIWHPEIEAEYIKVLRRKLKENNLDVKIWMYDHDFADVNRVMWMLDKCEGVKECVDGAAFHYYSGTIEETLKLRRMHPDLPLHFTEEIASLQFDAADLPDCISTAPLKRGDGVKSAAAFLSSLGEFDRKTLASNLAEDLCRLSPELLEQTLLLFTDADLTFGRMLTAQLGGL